MTLKEDLIKLEKKIEEEKWTGMMQAFYIDGGLNGIHIYRREKQLNEYNRKQKR